MTELTRSSALASRHVALGSGLEDWNGMGTAWTYHTNPNDEHDAVRESAGMFDMSPLKKVFIRGADAARVCDHVISRDTRKIEPGMSTYGSVLTEQGTVSDDAIVANNGNNEWTFCHGSGESMQRLQESAVGRNVCIELDDDLHNISLQGPRALSLLDTHTSMALELLPYFHHQETDLFGHPVRLSRTGYSGERGYEIFVRSDVVGDIWDQILGYGSDMGVMPCSFTALDKVRIEAGLLFYGYDMTSEHTPWEVGLGFTVNLNKSDFRGMAAATQSKGKERFNQVGLIVDHPDGLAGGEQIISNGQVVGTVNSPAWSHRLNQSLALAHVDPGLVRPGSEITVSGEGINASATVAVLPFFDPEKHRTHAV